VATRVRSLAMIFGLIIWSIWFVLIYSVLSIGCASKYAPKDVALAHNWLNGALFISTLITSTVLLRLAYINWQAIKPYASKATQLNCFIHWIAVSTYLTASIATLLIGIMILFFPPCV
jgi:hypothetical protein